MTKLGFRQFMNRSWESIWFDLGEDQEVLRKKLNGKWRNMLSNAEMKGLSTELSSDLQNFEWLANRCGQMLKDRGVSLPVKLYRQLNLEMISGQKMQILKAIFNQDPIAGICMVSHGNSATYLLGWSGEQGRRLKANHFFLWNAMMLLKNKVFVGLIWVALMRIVLQASVNSSLE